MANPFGRFASGFGRLWRGEVTEADFAAAVQKTKDDASRTAQVFATVPQLFGIGAGTVGGAIAAVPRGFVTGGASPDPGVLPQVREGVREVRRDVAPIVLDTTGTVADVAGGAVRQAGDLTVTILGTAGETVGKGAGALTKGFFSSPAGIATLAGGGILAYALLRR